MNKNREWAHLVAQAHGLYLRLRDRAGESEADNLVSHELVHQAYERYRRRVTRRF
jgi:hypothetical protein